jgi:hypothetical protein
VLTDALRPLDPADPPIAVLSDLQGDIPIHPARITIFLFETVEDPSSKNRFPSVTKVPPKLQKQKPPLALLLRYMLTPWSGDRLTDHRMLGRAMQVLYDGAVLSGVQLLGRLAQTNQALRISLSPLTIEERARVWYAIQKPYHLSVTYEIRVVNLDAVSFDTLTPATERSTEYLGPGAAQ